MPVWGYVLKKIVYLGRTFFIFYFFYHYFFSMQRAYTNTEAKCNQTQIHSSH